MLESTPSSQSARPTPASHPMQAERPRAVFCQEDFELIRNAIGQYLQQNADKPDYAKYSNLYHRLGRVT